MAAVGLRRYKANQFNWTKPDIFYFVEKRNKQLNVLKQQSSLLESTINSQKQYIQSVQKLITKTKNINYVGLQDYDDAIFNQKKQLIKIFIDSINNVNSVMDSNKELRSKVTQGFTHYVQEDLAYQSVSISLDKFESAITDFNSSYQSLLSFSPAMTNIDSLVSERINYQIKIKRLLSSAKRVFAALDQTYPYSKQFEDLIITNVGFLEARYESYFSTVYDKLAKETEQKTALTTRQLTELSNDKSLSTLRFPFHKDRPVEMTQESVDQDRINFEKLTDRKKAADEEIQKVKDFINEWNSYKPKLLALVSRYNKQHTFSSNLTWKTKQLKLTQKNEQKLTDFNQLISDYNEAYRSRINQLKKKKLKHVALINVRTNGYLSISVKLD